MQLEVDSIHMVGIVGLLVVVSACMHACVILHMPFVLEQRSVCVKQATHNAPDWTYFCLFLFSFCWFVAFFFFKFSLQPCVFFWTTWSSKVTVLEVYGSFWKGFFALKTGMAELTSCLSGFWTWTQSQRGMRCVSPGVCVGFCGEVCGECRRRGDVGRPNPFFVVGEEGCAEAKWHSEAFVFGSDSHFLSGDIMREAGSDIRFWPHMATGRPTDGSVCSQSLTSLTSTKRQSRTGTLSAKG